MPEIAADGVGWRIVPIALPAVGRSSPFAIDGYELLLCNAGGAGYVVANLCPHARAVLAGARLEGFVLECPLHGGKLDVRDGSAVANPIRKPVRTFPVRQSIDRLEVALPVKR
jgi:nitrite reductase/ring-hydroxylating ferredoxin subunit